MATTKAAFADTAFADTAFRPSAFAPARARSYQQDFLSRLFRKFVAARQRQADREIARYLASTGGKFTDSVEREIQRRLI